MSKPSNKGATKPKDVTITKPKTSKDSRGNLPKGKTTRVSGFSGTNPTEPLEP